MKPIKIFFFFPFYENIILDYCHILIGFIITLLNVILNIADEK